MSNNSGYLDFTTRGSNERERCTSVRMLPSGKVLLSTSERMADSQWWEAVDELECDMDMALRVLAHDFGDSVRRLAGV